MVLLDALSTGQPQTLDLWKVSCDACGWGEEFDLSLLDAAAKLW